MSTLDEVISTVLRAREDGPDALAAVAMSFGAAMELGTLGNTALKARLAETRAALEATEATVTTLRTERDAARDTAAQAAEVSGQATRDWDAAFDALCKARSDRDAAQAEAKAARESAADAAEVWRLRESVVALRSRAERAEAERDAAVQERESFSLRLSAAERARDEARAALDLARESAREAREEIAGALALVDEARARVEAIAVERNAIVSELSQATDAMMQARAECDALRDRPTYEARTVAPARRELERHKAEHGRWLVTWQESPVPSLCSEVVAGVWPTMTYPVGAVYLPLDASGIPCAWPVPSAEVSP